jgi:hypothetical protein
MRPPLKSLLLIAALSFAASTVFPQTKTAKVSVPFVGCESDGQLGPRKAPRGTNKSVSITAEAARKLAYYEAEDGLGVFAPLGWNCFEVYGSSGSHLFVSPQLIDSIMFLSRKPGNFNGPIVQLSTSYGGTSGRFDVAETIARVFPEHMQFTRNVVAESIESKEEFPQGPYPNDKLIYRNKETVEYQTPANKEGLGTHLWLKRNANSIDGVAMLVFDEPHFEYPTLIFLAARLPPDQTNLTQAIIQQTEQDAIKPK